MAEGERADQHREIPSADAAGPLDPSDEAARALRGDAAAWNALVTRHDRVVVLALLARGVRLDRARELSQEAWTRLLARQRAGQLERLLLPGLAIAQATWLARDDARRNRGDRLVCDARPDEVVLADGRPNAEDLLVSRAELERARAALEKCPRSAQRIFRMAYEEPDLPQTEIARRTGLSVQRVRQTLCEVRRRVREALERDSG